MYCRYTKRALGTTNCDLTVQVYIPCMNVVGGCDHVSDDVIVVKVCYVRV